MLSLHAGSECLAVCLRTSATNWICRRREIGFAVPTVFLVRFVEKIVVSTNLSQQISLVGFVNDHLSVYENGFGNHQIAPRYKCIDQIYVMSY